MTDEKIAGWDQYWAHGFLTSCADAFRGNYEGAMRGTWETAFSALPEGSRILDVATGNGAIALIAAATARDQGKKFSIDAFDLARIDPHKATARQHRELLDDIRFHPRVDAAALPFADAEFDFVCGHFALEYTAVERAVAELDRVCDKQAAGLFVMHHANSVILQTTAEEKRHLALLDETALFEHAGAFIDLVGSTAPKMRAHLQTLPHAEQLRTALNTAAARVTEAVGTATHPEILRTALTVVADAYNQVGTRGLDAATTRLASGSEQIRANASRLADLVAAARSRKQMAELESLFVANHFAATTVDTLEDDNGLLIGWTLEINRND